MTDTPLHNSWGQAAPEGTVVVLTPPSGNQCRAERVGLQGMVMAGVLAEGDSLTSLVDRKHIRRVRGGKGADREEIDAESLLNDPEAFGRIVMVMDRMMPVIIQWPKVALHFEDIQPEKGPKSTRKLSEDEREPDVVYTDQIPFQDKMYLFNWAVGGTADAERFLRESNDAVATVEDGQGVPHKAKRAAGGKKKRPRVRD